MGKRQCLWSLDRIHFFETYVGAIKNIEAVKSQDPHPSLWECDDRAFYPAEWEPAVAPVDGQPPSLRLRLKKLINNGKIHNSRTCWKHLPDALIAFGARRIND